VSLVIYPTSVYSIVRWDLARLEPEQVDEAWPESTILSAVLGAFMAWGPLCLYIHFRRTRSRFWGRILGLLVVAGVVALNVGVQLLLSLWLED
jgi:hypothetical protein